MVKMDESLLDESSLVSTIRTVPCSGIDKCVMCTNKVGAREPFFGVFGNLAEEKENGEAHTEFVLPELDTGGPIPKAMVRWGVMVGLDYWVAAVVMSAGCERRLCLRGSSSRISTGCVRRLCVRSSSSRIGTGCEKRLCVRSSSRFGRGRFYRNLCGSGTCSEKRGRRCGRGRERAEDRRSVELIYDISNSHLNCLWVAHVKSIKLGVAIPKLGCVCSCGRSPERSITVPERSQGCKKYTETGIYVNLAHKVRTCSLIDSRICRKGEAAILRVAVGNPDPRVQGRPQREHPVYIGVVQKEDRVEGCIYINMEHSYFWMNSYNE